MEDSETIKRAHEANVKRLIEEFGEGWGDRIRVIYAKARDAAELKARVREFTPIFLYREVRGVLESMDT